MPLNTFTDLENFQLTAVQYAQCAPIPSAGTPSTLLITAVGGQPAIVLLSAAVLATTGTGTAGSKTLGVPSTAGVVLGQLVYTPGGQIPAGTAVTAINGLVLTLSQAITVSMAGAGVFFVLSVSNATGIAVTPQMPVALAIGTSQFISYISFNGGTPGYSGPPGSPLGSYPGYPIQAVLNVAAGT
jgi:hypothetical protein